MKKKAGAAKDNKPGSKKTSFGRQEKDIDDLVHDEEIGTDPDQSEEDPDDKVHRIKRSQTDLANPDMEDPDDLVHGYREEDEE